MERSNLANPSPERNIAELLRVTLLLMKPYAPGVSPKAQLHELEDVMRHTIDTLERVDPRERSDRVLQFRRPQNLEMKNRL